MRTWLAALAVVPACWSSPKPASAPAKPTADQQAGSAGVLGSTALQQGGAFASLTATGDISSGFDDANVYGDLLGNEPGEMQGGFGYGRSGFGPGGGGAAVGTGSYGTIGHGSGTGSGYGVGGGRGGMRGRQASIPEVKIGATTVAGDLDPAIVRRYIRRNLPKLAYCYEKELLAQPKLAGSPTMIFVIKGDGKVGAHHHTSPVDLKVVGSCMDAVVATIEFPRPKDGNDVKVSYTFQLAPSSTTP